MRGFIELDGVAAAKSWENSLSDQIWVRFSQKYSPMG